MFTYKIPLFTSLALCSVMTHGALSGCGGGDSSETADAGQDESIVIGFDGGTSSPVDIDLLYPATVHTGFDGTNTYSAALIAFFHAQNTSGGIDPFGNIDASDVTWVIENPELADIVSVPKPPGEPFLREVWAQITTKGAGTTQITATYQDSTVTSILEISEYDPNVVANGRERYNNVVDAVGDRVSCASCHAADDGVDHSPLSLAVRTDEAILSISKTGTFEGDIEPYKTKVPHQWNLTPAEEAGLAPYIRTLPLRGITGQ